MRKVAKSHSSRARGVAGIEIKVVERSVFERTVAAVHRTQPTSAPGNWARACSTGKKLESGAVAGGLAAQP